MLYHVPLLILPHEISPHTPRSSDSRQGRPQFRVSQNGIGKSASVHILRGP
jgi:hypothetical protein